MCQKVCGRVFIGLLVVVCAVFLLMTTGGLVGRGQHIVKHNQLTTTDNRTSPVASRRRYSTSDEMRYILYGVGDDRFSPYDQQLGEFIRSHITEPSPTRPRQLARPQKTDVSQVGQSTFVDRLLSGRRNGFFVECGAADGKTFSNSLFFELERNWTGLLIEANEGYHRALLDVNRRAYVLQSCLSTERRPANVRMQPAGLLGGIADKIHPIHSAFIGHNKKPELSVNCFPLNTIMAALDVSHVDYLSLDVEGPELEILRTVDWTRLHIDVITVEYRIFGGPKIGIDKPATLKKLEDLRQFFRETGIYREVAFLPAASEAGGLDVVFSRIDYLPNVTTNRNDLRR